MSAIVGIYQTDNRPVPREQLEQMLAVLAHRGPDGQACWQAGAVGLGHAMHWTTPESLQETLPLTDAAAGLAITADARLDNRAELIAALGMNAGCSDSALILAAYGQWGEGCVHHLLGDFAFAIWDGRRQQLFCARDHFGVKPFYYFHTATAFSFASEIKGLTCLETAPCQLNEAYIAAYLVFNFEDVESTVYQGILRLPPAHTLVVTPAGLSLRPYWALDSARELRLPSDEAYAEAFRDVFAQAVRCRLRSAFPVGSTLSGGMDSSSITCMARVLLEEEGAGRRLQTFSAIYPSLPQSQCDERPYMQAVLEQGGVDAHMVPVDTLAPFWAYQQSQAYEDGPFPGTTIYAHWGMFDAARAQGVRVLLEGFNGDAIVSHGYENFSEMLHRGRWLTFLREARALAARYQVSSAPLVKREMRGLIPPAFKAFHRCLHGYTDTQRLLRDSPIAPALAERTQLVARLLEQERDERRLRTARAWHRQSVVSGLNTAIMETYNVLGHVFGIEERYPFFDRRVVEFCLSLPAEQKLRQGWARFIVRRGLAGILPPAIQWRVDKADHSLYFNRAVFREEAHLLRRICVEQAERLAPYIDTTALQEQLKSCLSDEMSWSRHWQPVWLAATLAVSLEHLTQPPAPSLAVGARG